MSKQFESIMEGLADLLEYAQGDTTKARSKVIEAPDITISPLINYDQEEIRQIRLNNNLSLKSFAACLGVSQKTVAGWENGRNTPSGSSLRLLQIFENKPNALKELAIISIENHVQAHEGV
jgi:putative transcriptional regulator